MGGQTAPTGPTGPTATAARIGVYGGTFDPVHLGHLIVADAAHDELELDRVLFVPAADPPHKPEAPISSAEHRLRMLELATVDNPAFSVSRADVDRPGPHYTIELLRLVAQEGGESASLHFIMGADSLADLLTWRDPARIVAVARLAVARRPGFHPAVNTLEASIPGLMERIDWINPPLVGISASDIRARVAQGRTITYLVPASVERYIGQVGLYAGQSG